MSNPTITSSLQSTLAALIQCLHKSLGSHDSHEPMDHPLSHGTLHSPTAPPPSKAVFTGAKYLKYIISKVICAIGGPQRERLRVRLWGAERLLGGAHTGYEYVRETRTKVCIHCHGPEQTWLSPSSKAISAFPQKPRGHRLGQRGET